MSMNLFDLYAKIVFDDSEYTEGIRAAADEAKSAAGEIDAATSDAESSLGGMGASAGDAGADFSDLGSSAQDTGFDLSDLSSSANDTTGAFGDASDASGLFGGAVDDTGGTIGDFLNGAFDGMLDGLTSKLPSGIGSAVDALGNMDVAMAGTVAAAAAVVTAIVKIEEALIDLTNESAASVDSILTDSAKYGISTDTLQEWRYAAELLDVSQETMTGSMTRMIRGLGDAKSGVGDAADAYKKLGVEITDSNGNLRNSEDIFNDTIEALRQMEAGTERDAIIMDIFGRSAQDLNPLLSKSSEEVAALYEEAHKLGYVMGEETLTALGAVDDSLQRFKNSAEAGKNEIAEKFAPSLEDFYEKASEVVSALAEAFANSGLVELFGYLLEIVGALGPVFEVLFKNLGDGTKSSISPFLLALGLVADALTTIANVVAILIELFRQLFNLIATGKFDDSNLTRYADNIIGVFSGSGATARALGIGQNASGTSNWHGGLTWVGENGPELVSLPSGSSIFSNADSRSMAGGISIGNITIDAKNVKEFNDIVRIAQHEAQSYRQGYAG